MRMEKQQLEQEKNITIEEYMSAVYGIVSDMDRPLSACVHSYGCQLNFSDGEKIKGMLLKMGCTLTDKPRISETLQEKKSGYDNMPLRMYGIAGTRYSKNKQFI